jgi:hypothetical protein
MNTCARNESLEDDDDDDASEEYGLTMAKNIYKGVMEGEEDGRMV